MAYNTGKGNSGSKGNNKKNGTYGGGGSLPRNQQRRNPQGGPAGSGVPGQNGKNKRRKWTGFTQKTFADGRTKGFSTFKNVPKGSKKASGTRYKGGQRGSGRAGGAVITTTFGPSGGRFMVGNVGKNTYKDLGKKATNKNGNGNKNSGRKNVYG